MCDGLRPAISVVVPTYNRAHLIGRALDSVLSQTFTDFEVIVVDDASTDDTGVVVQQYEDQRVRYIRNERNSGVSRSRNVGIRNARGKYIAFLDDDDEYFPDLLQETYQAFEAAPPSVACTWCGIRRVASRPEGEQPIGDFVWNPAPSPDAFRSFFMNRHFGSSHGFALRAACIREIGLFNERIRSAEDTEFFLRLVRVKGFRVIPKILVKRHMHDGPKLNVPSLARAEAYEIITEQNLPYLKKWRPEHAHMHHVTAKMFYAVGATWRARRHIVRSFWTHPLRLQAWRTFLVFELLGPRSSRRRKGIAVIRDLLNMGGRHRK